MEDKSIGKFISILRKSKGMTQKELGEKLFVSDKTISRWERGDCAPEISLLHTIAEVFDVTVDELLRGERNSVAGEETAVEVAMPVVPVQKMEKLTLDQKLNDYKNKTFISIFLSIVGLAISILIGLYTEYAWIGFAVAMLMYAGSEICQLCLANNCRNCSDEKARENNTKIVNIAIVITFINVILSTFSVTFAGVTHGNARLLTSITLCIGTPVLTFLLLYVVYALVVRKRLCNRGWISLTDEQQQAVIINNTLLKKLLIACVVISLVLGVALIVLNSINLEMYSESATFESLKSYVESDYDNWAKTNADSMTAEKLLEYKSYGNVVNSNGVNEGEVYYHKDHFKTFYCYEDPNNGAVSYRAVYNVKVNSYFFKTPMIVLNSILIATIVAHVVTYIAIMFKNKKQTQQ